MSYDWKSRTADEQAAFGVWEMITGDEEADVLRIAAEMARVRAEELERAARRLDGVAFCMETAAKDWRSRGVESQWAMLTSNARLTRDAAFLVRALAPPALAPACAEGEGEGP